MSAIVIYDSSLCPYCRAARRLLESKGWDYESLNVDGDPELRREMVDKSGRTSVPQIFFGDQHVGGFDDMAALDAEGELDKLYASTGNGS